MIGVENAQEDSMIDISEVAVSEIEKVLKEKSPEGDKALRVYAMGFG